MLPVTEFTRNFIEPGKSRQYTLSIRITADGFCFCVLDNARQKFIFFKNAELNSFTSIAEQIKQLIDIEPIFDYSLEKIVITFVGQHYTLFPSKLFDSEKKKEIFAFSQPLAETEQVRYDRINGTEILTIYSLPKDLLDLLNQKFPQALILHQASVLLKDIACQEGTQIWVDVHRNFFFASMVSNGKLLMSNSFSYKNDTEFLYFVMSLIDKFELDANSIPLLVSGNIGKEGNLAHLLKEYIRFVVFDNCSSNYSFVPEFEGIECQELSKLIAACEL
jgi:hypothetical protein